MRRRHRAVRTSAEYRRAAANGREEFPIGPHTLGIRGGRVSLSGGDPRGILRLAAEAQRTPGADFLDAVVDAAARREPGSPPTAR